MPGRPEAKEKIDTFSVDMSLTLGENEVEPVVSPMVGEVTDGVVISGDTEEEAEEMDPGPPLLMVTDDSGQGPLCLPGVAVSEEAGAPAAFGVKGRDAFHLATKLVPRSPVVLPWSDVGVSLRLVSTERTAAARL